MKLALALLVALTPSLAGAENLTGQHALYNLTLTKIRTHNITGATGQMSFDVIDGCTGWGTTQHMTLLLRNIDSSLTKTVTDYITWESKDGRTLTFTLREKDNDGKQVIDDAGSATHGADGSGTITYTTPAGTTLSLPPGTLFPMQHTQALLEAGTQGKKFLAVPLFDGTSPNGAEATFIAELGHHGPQANPYAPLAAIPSSDVDIAFYNRKTDDENPDFRTQMQYFDNGVAYNIILDFGDFVMTGKLTSLTIPAAHCGK
jgi:hypothetical protein